MPASPGCNNQLHRVPRTPFSQEEEGPHSVDVRNLHPSTLKPSPWVFGVCPFQ